MSSGRRGRAYDSNSDAAALSPSDRRSRERSAVVRGGRVGRIRAGGATAATRLLLYAVATVGAAHAKMAERWGRDELAPQCVFGDSLLCLAPDKNDTDSTTALVLARSFFLFVVYVLVCVISSRYMYGVGAKWKSNFTGSILFGLVVVQLYHVFMASMVNYPYDGINAYRWDCLQSTKGGKISREMFIEESKRALNPCYCHEKAACRIGKGENMRVIYPPRNENWTVCPVGPEYSCFENFPENNTIKYGTFRKWTKGMKQNKTKIEPYLSLGPMMEGYRRDCAVGQGAMCTKKHPCTPCELDRLEEFGAVRCETCSAYNDGNCHFVPGVGPYCWESADSKNVVPCKQCCTEPTDSDGNIVKDANGHCV